MGSNRVRRGEKRLFFTRLEGNRCQLRGASAGTIQESVTDHPARSASPLSVGFPSIYSARRCDTLVSVRHTHGRELMRDECGIVDLGDAMVETRQLGPGPHPDSMWGWGVRPG
jgi:hypothetical protein